MTDLLKAMRRYALAHRALAEHENNQACVGFNNGYLAAIRDVEMAESGEQTADDLNKLADEVDALRRERVTG